MAKLFLSHAAADKPLVDDLKTLIQTCLGLAPNDFFYSSGKGTGVPAGHNFVEYIRDQMDDSTFVVTVITPAFRESEFCLAELGAVWVTAEKDFFPLCTPSVNRSELRATLTGIQVERIDEDASLADLLQRIARHLHRDYNAAACTEQVNAFLASLPARLASLQSATKVAAEDFEQAQVTISTLGDQVTRLRDDLATEKDRFELLKDAKLADEIAQLEVPEDAQERTEHLIARAEEAVRELERDVRDVVPYAVRGDGMPWPDKGSWEHADVEKQVDEGYLYDGEDGRVYLNTDWPVVEAALEAARELQEHLERLSPEEQRWFRQTHEVPADISQTAVFKRLF